MASRELIDNSYAVMNNISPERLFHPSPKSFTRDLLTASASRSTSSDALQQLREGQLSYFGEQLQGCVRGRGIIDLGCGDSVSTHDSRQLARSFGASSYTGVDIAPHEQSVFPDTFPESFVQADMLDFLTSLSPQNTGLVFIVNGIEPFDYEIDGVRQGDPNDSWTEFDKRNKQTLTYINSCMKEIDRVTASGDGILIGTATFNWQPEQYGFRQTDTYKTINGNRRKNENTLYIKA